MITPIKSPGMSWCHCISAGDRELVREPGDYEAIYATAVNLEVSLSDITEALNRTFKASFDGQPVLEQLLKDKNGSGKMDAIRMWAGQERQAWQMTKEQWSGLSLPERAQMICTVKLPDWLQALEFAKREKER